MKSTKLAAFFIAASLTSAVSLIAFNDSNGKTVTPTASKSDLEVLKRSSNAFNDVAKKATPAVVSINSIKSSPTIAGPFPFDLPGPGDDEEDQPIPPDLFDSIPPHAPGGPGMGPGIGVGSGVIIRNDGVIVTNNHVVEDAEKITVSLDENTKISAHLIGTDEKTDIAIIKMDKVPRKLETIRFGNSNTVQVGDWAVAIGSPFGLSHSVTSGIISAKSRGQMGVFDIEDFIQTDAPINPGNSGGPLLNINGEMIGLNTAIFSETGGFIGIGFAISSNLAKQVSDDILAHGRVIRGWMGVAAQDMDPELAKYFKIPEQKGALISRVQEGGPASKSTLKEGDVVRTFNNTKISNSTDLREAVTKTKSGTEVTLEVMREGKQETVAVKISEQPQPHRVIQKAGKIADNRRKASTEGIRTEDVPSELGKYLGVPDGKGAMITSIAPGTSAFDAGLSPGDVILKANDEKIKSSKDFKKFGKDLEENELTVLYVQRGPEKRLFIPLKPTA